MSATTIFINISEFSILMTFYALQIVKYDFYYRRVQCAACSDRYMLVIALLFPMSCIMSRCWICVESVGARVRLLLRRIHCERLYLKVNETLPGVWLGNGISCDISIVIPDISICMKANISLMSSFSCLVHYMLCVVSEDTWDMLSNQHFCKYCRLSIFMNKFYVGTYCDPNVERVTNKKEKHIFTLMVFCYSST